MTVTLELAKQQCRVTHDSEDGLLTQYAASANAWVERFTSLHLEETEVVDRFTTFGDYLQLSRGPFLSLTSIDYTDAAGDPQAVEGARVRDGRIYAPEAGWPEIGEYTTIEATYLAGYGDAYHPVPDELVQAQLLLIGHWYVNRQAVVTGSISSELQFAVEALARPFRLPVIA